MKKVQAYDNLLLLQEENNESFNSVETEINPLIIDDSQMNHPEINSDLFIIPEKPYQYKQKYRDFLIKIANHKWCWAVSFLLALIVLTVATVIYAVFVPI